MKSPTRPNLYHRVLSLLSLVVVVLVCIALVRLDVFPTRAQLVRPRLKCPVSNASGRSPVDDTRILRHGYPNVSLKRPPTFKPTPVNQGRLLSGKAQQNCFKLLLVIIFNRPGHYYTVPFLKEIYRKAFRHIVVYGPGKNLPEGVRPSLDESGGNFQHRTAVQAMKDYPNYDGYLWIGDDIWLNFAQILSTMDADKIWYPLGLEKNWIDEKKYVDKKWPQWASSWGIPAVRKCYADIPKKFVDHMAEEFGERGVVLGGYSDVVYVPRRFAADFITIGKILRDVFFEIAIPTTLHFISKASDRESFRKPVTLWYDGKRDQVWDFWSLSVTFLHPLKASSEKHRHLARSWTNQLMNCMNFVLPNQYNC